MTTQLFIAFVAMGLLLLALEVFIPGGILGIFGAIALMIAVVIGFAVFGPQGGLLMALGLLIFTVVFFALWLKLFPRTRIGKTLTLSQDGKDFKTDSDAPSPLLGRTGVAATNLQLSGIVEIDGKRVDVVSESGFITAGAAVKVVAVHGHRVVVREVAAS